MLSAVQIKILKTIYNKKEISTLVSKQIGYITITKELVNLANMKYIFFRNEKYWLTKKAKDELSFDKKTFEVIQPLNKYKIEQIKIDEIFIPKYNKEDKTKN